MAAHLLFACTIIDVAWLSYVAWGACTCACLSNNSLAGANPFTRYVTASICHLLYIKQASERHRFSRLKPKPHSSALNTPPTHICMPSILQKLQEVFVDYTKQLSDMKQEQEDLEKKESDVINKQFTLQMTDTVIKGATGKQRSIIHTRAQKKAMHAGCSRE